MNAHKLSQHRSYPAEVSVLRWSSLLGFAQTRGKNFAIEVEVKNFAKKRLTITVIDNTWATPLNFRPLEHGVDLSVEAASKLFGGHSDVLMGAVATRSRSLYEKLRRTQSMMGQAVSTEDCFLVLRGLDTFAVRLEAQSKAASRLAQWLEMQPDVMQVLFPSLKDDPGHALWKRDFRGAGCVLIYY